VVQGAGGTFLDGEPQLSVSEADVVTNLETLLKRPRLPAGIKEVVLTSLMKLTARLPTQVSASEL
jgi:hypothetical protein